MLGVKCIQRALTRIQSDRFTPALLSAEIADYFFDLTIRHLDNKSAFSKFVLSPWYEAIENKLLD